MKTIQEILDEQRLNSNIHKLTKKDIGFAKISDSTKGQDKSDEARMKMSIAAKKREPNQLGLKRTPEQIENIKNGWTEEGLDARIEGAKKGGLWHKGKPKPQYLCPHCNRMIAANMFDRYHNDNCKLKSA